MLSFALYPYVYLLARASFLAQSRTLLEAARGLGVSHRRIVLAHLLPNVLPPLLVYTSPLVGMMIVASAGLSFLGLGAKPSTATWGSMVRDAFNNGYDVVLISDATASGNTKHFESTLEVVREYYGLVMNIATFGKYLPQKANRTST